MQAMSTRQVLFTLALSLWLLAAQGAGGQARPREDPLSRRVRDVRVEATGAPDALSQLAYDYNIPIGIEMASKGKAREIKLDMREGTLREVLDAVAAQDTRYEWREEGGVVNFVPKTDRDELSADVLGTTLKQFAVEKGAAIIDIKGDIINRPEVRSKLDGAGVTARIGGFTGGDFRKAGRDFSLRMSNATVREVLNQLIRKSEVKYWVVNRFGDNNETFLLNF